jgi:predicted sulfurtransferase
MTVAEYLAYFIEQKGIKNVFQLSGGMITQLIVVQENLSQFLI